MSDKFWARCTFCGGVATCVGRYEGPGPVQNGCDEHCGHGNEDGWCVPVADAADKMTEILARAELAERLLDVANGATGRRVDVEAEITVGPLVLLEPEPWAPVTPSAAIVLVTLNDLREDHEVAKDGELLTGALGAHVFHADPEERRLRIIQAAALLLLELERDDGTDNDCDEVPDPMAIPPHPFEPDNEDGACAGCGEHLHAVDDDEGSDQDRDFEEPGDDCEGLEQVSGVMRIWDYERNKLAARAHAPGVWQGDVVIDIDDDRLDVLAAALWRDPAWVDCDGGGS